MLELNGPPFSGFSSSGSLRPRGGFLSLWVGFFLPNHKTVPLHNSGPVAVGVLVYEPWGFRSYVQVLGIQ